MIVTYLLDIRTLPDPMEEKGILDGLPPERIEKISRLRHPASRKQSLGAGLLLEHGLHQSAAFCGDKKQGVYGAEICEKLYRYNGKQEDRRAAPVISRGVYGKPYLADSGMSRTTQDMFYAIPFNLSHTGRYVIASVMFCGECGMRSDAVIGCDIEQVKHYNPRIARRFFTQAEYRQLEDADARQQAELFCRYWTRKESVLKMTGLGMSLPMDLFEISSGSVTVPDQERLKAWREAAEGKAQSEAFGAAEKLLLGSAVYLKEYRYDGCCITVCSTYDRFAPQITAVKWVSSHHECFDTTTSCERD